MIGYYTTWVLFITTSWSFTTWEHRRNNILPWRIPSWKKFFRFSMTRKLEVCKRPIKPEPSYVDCWGIRKTFHGLSRTNNLERVSPYPWHTLTPSVDWHTYLAHGLVVCRNYMLIHRILFAKLFIRCSSPSDHSGDVGTILLSSVAQGSIYER